MMKTFLISLLLLMSSIAFGQFSNQEKQYLSMDNLLSNPGLENGKAGWTCAAGTFTADSSAKIDGGLTGKVVLSSQTLDCSISVNTNSALQSAAGVILQAIKTSVAGIQVCSIVDGTTASTCNSYDGSNIVKEVSPVYFTFGATSVGIRIKTASAVTGTVYFDGSKIGRISSAMMPEISQAQLAGESYFAGSTNCAGWARTSATIGAFSTDSDCPGPTISYGYVGSWQTTDSDLPRQTINSLPPGKYKATFFVASNTSTAVNTVLAINDGTTTCEAVTAFDNGTAVAPQVVSCIFEYAAVGNRVFELYGASSNAASFVIWNNHTAPRGSVKFQLEYYPSPSTVMANYYPWKVDVNIGGASPSLGTANVASYTEITNASLDMVLNSGSAAVRIPCSSTNASTGLTCSSGSESVGVNIPSGTLPFPGEYRVCSYMKWRGNTNVNQETSVTFELNETTPNTQTIVQEGKTRNGASVYGGGGTTAQDHSIVNCGNLIFSDTGEKTIRLMYEQAVTGGTNSSNIISDRGASYGQQDIRITIEPVTPFMIASVKDMVSSKNVQRANFCSFGFGGSNYRNSCSSSPCAIFNNKGCTPTVTRVSSSNYEVNFPAGTWADASYNCTYGITTYLTGSQPPGVYETVDKTATKLTIQTINAAGNTDSAMTLNCFGTN